MDERRTRTKQRMEEYEAASRQLRAQAEACRERARAHDHRMESVMEMLSRGWQGPRANALLHDLEDIRQGIRGQYLAQASELDAYDDDLQQTLRRTEEETEAEAEEERKEEK